MVKKDDYSRFKIITKIVDFLLEECSQIEKPNLKVEIFMNVCSFLREWYRFTETMILPTKTFECLTMLMSISQQIDTAVFVGLVDLMMKPLYQHQLNYPSRTVLRDMPKVRSSEGKKEVASFIELIHFIDKPLKYNVMIDVTIALLETILQCNKVAILKSRKPILIQFLSAVLKQTEHFWRMCLKYEDKYNYIAAIKE